MTSTRTERVACDGGDMDLFVWVPDAPSGKAVLVIQEIFGVGPYIRAVCERLADAGYVAAAPDVFWRFSAGWAAGHDQQGLTDSIGKVQQLDFPMATLDCAAALAHLGALPEVDGTPAVLGYCLGGTLAFAVASAAQPSSCVSYYGSGVPSMIGQLDHVSCPILFHFGNADAYIPNEGVDAVAAAINGRADSFVNVENAGHAFDNHEAEMFYNESAARAAWTKTMAFLDTYA